MVEQVLAVGVQHVEELGRKRDVGAAAAAEARSGGEPAGRDRNGFVMLGKTFKGLTDEMLRWQTERLRELAVSDDGRVVVVRPELVVEIAFDGVQSSPRYPGGVALRFARVLRHRPDKRAEDADTLSAVLAFSPGDA
jgi:ATP-dependent DNA ligase